MRYGNFGVPDQREACGLRGNWGVLPGAPPGVAEARHLKYGREPLATHAVCRGSGLRGTTQVAAEVAPKGMGFDGVDGARSPAFWAQSAGHLVGQTVGMGTAHFLVQRRTGLRAPCGTTAQGRGLGGIGARRGIPEVTPSVTSPGGMEARRTERNGPAVRAVQCAVRTVSGVVLRVHCCFIESLRAVNTTLLQA